MDWPQAITLTALIAVGFPAGAWTMVSLFIVGFDKDPLPEGLQPWNWMIRHWKKRAETAESRLAGVSRFIDQSEKDFSLNEADRRLLRTLIEGKLQ